MGWLGGAVMVAALGATPVAREVAPPMAQNKVATREVASRVATREAAPAAAQEQEAQTASEFAAAMSYPSSVCKKKRVDACGCHHVYGVRHCHPDRKGKHCEAIVKAELPWLQQEPESFKL